MTPDDITRLVGALKKRATIIRAMSTTLQRFGPHPTWSADAVESELNAMAKRVEAAADHGGDIASAIMGVE